MRWTLAIGLLTTLSCGRAQPVVRTRMRDRDALCSDRAKPVAFHYAMPDDAYRAGCYDVRVHQSDPNPRTGKAERWEDLVFCCPR